MPLGRLLGDLDVVLGMTATDGRFLPGFGEPLAPVLADRLEHGEARLALDGVDASHEVVVHQGNQTIQDVPPELSLRVRDCFCRLQVGPPGNTARRRNRRCSGSSSSS